MRSRHVGWIGMVLAVALFLSSAVGVSHAGGLRVGTLGNISGDTSSDGAAITVVLFATICVVLVLLGLRADYQNVFGQLPPGELEEREAQFAERMDAALQSPEFRPVLRSALNQPEAQWANVGLGLRLEF